MTFAPGQVVTLKSSSQPMTVVSVVEEDIDCVWIGDEGEFFRETIPAVALTAVASDEEDLEDEADADSEDETEDHEPEESEPAKGKRRVA
jgi:uncharacterized protein YodC (DUF2158 family)